MRKFLGCSALTLSFMIVNPALAQSAPVTLSAEFDRGAIAEYSNGPNGTSNAQIFSQLSIRSITITQVSANGLWGGSQGNDTSVTLTISYTNGSTLAFPAAINWVKNSGGGGFDWVGLTTSTNQNDGYTPPNGGSKTYILQFPQSSLNLATLLPNGLDGSANQSGALNALNELFPGPGASTLTFTSANAFSYLENSSDTAVIGTVQTANAGGTVTYSITSGNANGWYEINPTTGAISLTPAGVAAAEPNDFETLPNSRTITVQANDGSNIVAQTITLSELNVVEAVPITFANPASFDYPENSGETDVLATISANGGAGTLNYSITAGNTQGWYEINSATGEITLTASGVTALANDFESSPNDHVLTVQASDGTNAATMDITLSETDLNEAPTFTNTNATSGGNPSYAFDYAEGQTAGAQLGQVAASDSDPGDTLTFAIAAGNANGWFQVDPATGAISLTATGVAAAANDFENAPNAHTLTVTASDGTDMTSIEVLLSETDIDETAPVITGPSGGAGAAASTINVNEGTTSVTQLTSGETVTWSITGGTDQGLLEIDGNGNITFVNAPDFEAPADSNGDNVYVIEVSAQDANGNVATQTITINVLDTDDSAPNTAPTFTGTNATSGGNPSYAFDYAEGQVAGAQLGQVAASDSDPGDTLTFAIASGNANGWFQVDPATGAISLTATGVAAAANDFENAPNAHTLTVTASDGTDTTSIEVLLSETDIDETAPVITGPSGGAGAAASTINVNEGTTSVTQLTSGETVTWSITGGTDQGLLEIDGNGNITFVDAPDFEAPADSNGDNVYVIEVSAEDANGNVATQTITINVLDVNEAAPNTAPAFTNTNATSGGNPSYAFDYAEGQTAGAQLGQVAASDVDAGDAITFAIASGNANGWFQVDPATGAISLTATGVAAAANDFENAPNAHTLTVTASDGTDTTSIEVLLSETDVDETAPVITGPSGGAGAAASTINVNEGTTSVTRLTSGETVTWSITGGTDQGLLEIDGNGNITFVDAPDFEAPADSNGDNVYVIEVSAEDANGNVATQTITINVLDTDDSAPKVTESGTPVTNGQASFEVIEGNTGVASFSSDENVTWAIVDGDDRGQFSFGADGELVFSAAPDFESPVDTDSNNVYLLAIEATDDFGNTTRLLLDVTVLDQEELQDRVNQISDALRQGLRSHALVGLSDLLSYNEGLMLGDAGCASGSNDRDLSGSLNADEHGQSAEVRFNQALTACGRNLRVLLDAGATVTRLDGNSRVRSFGSVRIEKNLSDNAQLGVSLIGSTASDSIDGFADSGVSDWGLTSEIYSRVRMDENLIAGAFVGFGKGWYDFDLKDDGLSLRGNFTGNRLIAGAMMRGETTLNQRPLTIDAVISHARESLDEARFAASLESESADNMLLDLGQVEHTRLSVPVTYSAFGPIDTVARGTGLDLRGGGLCESSFHDGGLECGFQSGGRLWHRTRTGNYAYLDINYENAAGLNRVRFDAGYTFDIGLGDNLAIAFNTRTLVSGSGPGDYAGFVSLKARP